MNIALVIIRLCTKQVVNLIPLDLVLNRWSLIPIVDIDKPEAHRNITLVIIRLSTKQVVTYTYSRYR